MKIFEFNPGCRGSLIDPISNTAGTLTAGNGGFRRTEKGLALRSDGVATKLDIVNSATNDPYALYGTFHIVAAFKVNNLPALNYGGGVFVKGDGGDSYGVQIANTGGALKIRCGIRGSSSNVVEYDITIGKWNLVEFYFNEASSQVYINNIGQGSIDLSGHGYTATAEAFTIAGDDIISGNAAFTNIDVAYVKMFDSLSTAERNTLYQQFLQATQTEKPTIGFEYPKPTDLSSEVDSVTGSQVLSDTEFDNPARWSITQPATTSILNGQAIYNGTGGGNYVGEINNTLLTNGAKYKIIIDIEDYTGGGVYIGYAGAYTPTYSSNGTHIWEGTVIGTRVYIYANGTTTLKVNSLSIQPISGLVAAYNFDSNTVVND